MSILEIVPGQGFSNVVGSLSNNSLQTAEAARQNGTATNVFSTTTDTTELNFSQAYTNNGSSMAVAIACIPDNTSPNAVSITATFTRTSDSQVFDLPTVALSASNWDKNDPGVAIAAGTGVGTGAGTVDITVNINDINILSHAISIISMDNVASFGNIVSSAASDRSSVAMTSTGVTDGDFIMAAGTFQGGGTDWTASAGWDTQANDGTNDADQFNDCTMLFQTFDAVANGNVAFTMTLNSAFAASEFASGVVLLATSNGPS